MPNPNGPAVVPRGRRLTACAVVLLVFACWLSAVARAQAPLPELTEPVNDFARVIDPASREATDRLVRALQQATGDVVVVATVETVAPYSGIEEYAVKLFENHGRGIGDREKKNGLLVLLSVKDRRARIEVGYGLEPYITDGFAGETIRQYMIPAFRQQQYGEGLRAGVERLVARLAEAQHAQIEGVRPTRRIGSNSGGILLLIFGVIVLVVLLNAFGSGSRRGPRGWGGGPWSGWSSGVGPFGRSRGGFGGGFGGFGGFGGGGGGFGGFGGGSSGGGGASGGW